MMSESWWLQEAISLIGNRGVLIGILILIVGFGLVTTAILVETFGLLGDEE
ncbi:MAG: hypothetical protein KAJ03_05380 [Gammaproteobacteria bacterium]|nr:hypothetical protein [Gammaproteobacteria bacterium]